METYEARAMALVLKKLVLVLAVVLPHASHDPRVQLANPGFRKPQFCPDLLHRHVMVVIAIDDLFLTII